MPDATIVDGTSSPTAYIKGSDAKSCASAHLDLFVLVCAAAAAAAAAAHPDRVESPDCSDFSSALGGADVSTLDLNVVPLGKGSALEGEAFELSTTAHIQYTLGTASQKPYRGIIRVQKTTDRLTVSPGGWKIDEDVFPLDAPKIYATIQPVRKGTSVYMSLDPKIKKAKF